MSEPARQLTGLAALLGVPPDEAWSGVMIRGVAHDSRSVRRGDVYVALPGARFHGADFAAQAHARGAVALIADPTGEERARASGLPVLVVPHPRERLGEVAAWVYGRPSDDLLLVGITGTNGKTTTAYLLESGLRAAGHRSGLIGTVETRIGGDVVRSVHTTPEATDLQALLAVMRERGVGAVAMEVSSHALALDRVAGTTYDVAVFTNLSQDHLDFHADIEDYFHSKAGLFTAGYARAGVVNVDDHYGRVLADRAEIPVTTYSPSGDHVADWRAEGCTPAPSGSGFVVVGPEAAAAAHVRLPGMVNVANALAAIVAAVTAGVPLRAAVDGVAAVSGVPGRMEAVDAGQPYLALVDYAHTPDALETLLTGLRDVTRGRLSVVVGCGGDRDRTKRPLMGQVAARCADLAVLTNDNPRSEDPQLILAAMWEGAVSVPGGERAQVVVEPDRAAAISLAVARAGPGDTVVVAGKGHEQGQEVQGAVRPFDDHAVLRGAISRGARNGTRGRTPERKS
ncbi:MAG: UDP-N-acetylmuramoyl-L-alanyl-D-glutamate--2,6-diaminopimelate ligase [Carbonactinosporaceae bacterium]